MLGPDAYVISPKVVKYYEKYLEPKLTDEEKAALEEIAKKVAEEIGVDL